MLPRARRFLLLVPLAGALLAQTPALPAWALQRYVDFSRHLAQPGVVVAVGTLGKFKEGKRERLADGKLGGAGSLVSISGMQIFRVPTTATMQPRTLFFGKADKLVLTFDVQLARLPDGSEQRQVTTGNGATIAEDQLALFVIAPRDKGKGFDLVAVVPFDARLDAGPDAELGFVDAMRDYFAVNRRVHDLTAALTAIDQASDAPAKAAAEKALGELVEQKLTLRRPANDGLLAQHTAPLEARARQRLTKVPPGETGK